MFMVCKYLVKINNTTIKVAGEPNFCEQYADKIGCCACSYQCPKKKIILKITPHCWRLTNAEN